GDLLLLCGESNARFLPSGKFAFERLSDLQFTQVDDYFGVPSLADDGTDVVVWLYPIVRGEPVERHRGPYDAFRLDFNVLRNPERHQRHYLRCVEEMASYGERVLYRSRGTPLGNPPNLTPLRDDLRGITEQWASQGIAVGSQRALEIDF